MGEGKDEAFKRISEFADLSMWKRGVPGMVLGVTDRHGTLFSSAKGFSEVSCRRPMDIDALFQIGSVSKSFTCMVLLQLAERGVLDLHAPVKEYLPWFSVKSRYPEITLHHLMTHTAGIVIGADATPTGWTEVWDLRDTEATAPPGTHYHYSNSGYKVLCLVLETVTGRRYGDLIREGVLDAAGMRSTEPVITNGIRGRLAVGHMPTHDDRPFHRRSGLSPSPWFEGDTGDGTICAPLEDMLAYIRVFLNRGQGPWGQILSPDSFRKMTTPHIETDDGAHGDEYCYGLVSEKAGGRTRISHTGGMVGFFTAMRMDMDSGIGVMVMVNGPGDPDEVAKFALETMVACSKGDQLPDVPSREDAFRVGNAADYVGTYTGPEGVMEVTEKAGTPHLTHNGRESTLEHVERDAFFSEAPGLELFLLEFERVDGQVVRVHHGEHTFRKGEASAEHPSVSMPEGIRFDGHYRSHNPWLSNFRVVRREDGLVLAFPSVPSIPLVHLKENEFRIGPDPRCPERIEFGCVIDGVATSATVSGGGRLGRTFTP